MDCGCKGVRFCDVCKSSERVRNLDIFKNGVVSAVPSVENVEKQYVAHVYCPKCNKAIRLPAEWKSRNLEGFLEFLDRNPCEIGHNGLPNLEIDGIFLVTEFLTETEESELLRCIDTVPWVLSQSGRRKQDYGAKVNFKKQKVKYDQFDGMPSYADLILSRMAKIDENLLGSYQPFELCNLEYTTERGSSIEFHVDDTWIWGERLICVNLLSGSVMSFVKNGEIDQFENRCIIYTPMRRRSLLCIFGEMRYEWMHGIAKTDIVSRRIALTMREPEQKFRQGELFEKYGRELIRRGNLRLDIG